MKIRSLPIANGEKDGEGSMLKRMSFSEEQLNLFSESTRLVAKRKYAKKNPYKPQNLELEATLADLSPPRSLNSSDPERFWLVSCAEVPVTLALSR